MKICVRKKEPKLYAIIDDEDFELINRYNWSIHSGGYAKGYENPRHEKSKYIYMHRLILNVKKGEVTDHINHNKLDNRKCNLRICTSMQSNMNRNSYRGISKYKGVSFCKNSKRIKKWCSQIRKNNKHYTLGYFMDEIEAAKSYNEAAKEMFGDFALLNKI